MSLFHKVVDNPILLIDLRQRVRHPMMILTIVTYLIGIGFIFALLYADAESKSHYYSVNYGQEFFKSISYMEILLLTVYLSVIASQGIVSELRDKTFDFLVSSPLSSWNIALGKLSGIFVLLFLMIAITLPLKFLSTIMGGVDFKSIFYYISLLILYSCFISSIGLFMSTQVKNTRNSVFIMIILNMFIFIFSVIISEVFRYDTSLKQGYPLITAFLPMNIISKFLYGDVYFNLFTLKLPFWIGILVTLGSSIFLFYYITVRSIRRFSDPISILSPKGTLLTLLLLFFYFFVSLWSSYSNQAIMSYKSTIERSIDLYIVYYRAVVIFFLTIIPFFPILPRKKDNEMLPEEGKRFPYGLPRGSFTDILWFCLYLLTMLLGPVISSLFYSKTYTYQAEINAVVIFFAFFTLLPFVILSRIIHNILPKKRLSILVYELLVFCYFCITLLINESPSKLKSVYPFLFNSVNPVYLYGKYLSTELKTLVTNMPLSFLDNILFYIFISCMFTLLFLLIDYLLKPFTQRKSYLPQLEDY